MRFISLGAVFFVAISFPIGALAMSVVSPFLPIALRFTVIAVLLWCGLLLQHLACPQRALLPRGVQWWWAVTAGILVQGVQILAAYWAIAHGVSPGMCALVIAMNPVATAGLARLLGGRSENRWGYLALAAGVVGVVSACLPMVLSDPRLGPGLLAVLLALAGLAVGSFLQSRHLTGVTPAAFTAIGTTASIPPAIILALTEPEHVSDVREALTLLVVLVVTSALGTVFYAACVQRSGARQASALFAVIPAVAAVGSWALLGTDLGVSTLIGLAFGALACLAQVKAARFTAAQVAIVTSRT
ncbi:DMT family transporter [Microbacterium terrisoli]|uniref:DMT family transporter n=1 Tax=Microbacterium terrisoli TaxID=3242192 RepID=UPI00280460BD|nr:DMT family transporter [Microbacterium protaetiae]